VNRGVPVSPPPGYVRTHVANAVAITLPHLAPAIAEILARGTIYDHAAAHTARRVRTGRGPVYIVPIAGNARPVVVRHTRHGGALAKLTGDRFLAPTRAPRELEMSLRLAALGIPSPTVLGYALYAAGPFLNRSDVMTEEIPESADLAAVLGGASPIVSRGAAVSAATELLVAMGRHGVHHPDLNLKNILIAADRVAVRAILLDVDRVRIDPSRARAAASNAARLARSARKWRDRHGAPITEDEIGTFTTAALGGRP
jgi:hypothetical protein